MCLFINPPIKVSNITLHNVDMYSTRVGLGHARLGRGQGRVLRWRPVRRGGSLRLSVAWPGTEAGKSGDCVWSCPFQPLADVWVGIRGAGREELPGPPRTGGFLEVWELIWEGLFDSAWQGGRD